MEEEKPSGEESIQQRKYAGEPAEKDRREEEGMQKTRPHAGEKAQLIGTKVLGCLRPGSPARGSFEKQVGITIRLSERENPTMQGESGSTPGCLE